MEGRVTLTPSALPSVCPHVRKRVRVASTLFVVVSTLLMKALLVLSASYAFFTFVFLASARVSDGFVSKVVNEECQKRLC